MCEVVLKDKSGGYQTASAPTNPPAGEGAFTLIRFAPQATQDDVTKFLAANKLSIASGPVAEILADETLMLEHGLETPALIKYRLRG